MILGLQHLSGLPFYIGGLTALNLQGFAHYIPVGGGKKIAIYGKSNPPGWIKNIKFSQEFIFSKKPSFDTLGIKKHATKIRDWQINISTPERVILELLYQVEKEGTSFQFVAEIFEGFTILSP
ncbi:MAG TPA: hypothetical protein EYH01_04785, partial [Campylobacterales bacterium]|nr:hypothetical protein [Campylobacterales bacterium]